MRVPVCARCGASCSMAGPADFCLTSGPSNTCVGRLLLAPAKFLPCAACGWAAVEDDQLAFLCRLALKAVV